MSELLLCSIRFRPTTPEEFPSPWGWRGVAERNSKAALLIAPAARTTTSAEYSSRAPARSTTTRRTERPDVSVSSRVTNAPVSNVTFGVPQRRIHAHHLRAAFPLVMHG
jgi:hypothetical protein